jgi:hypothetical protein
MKKRLLALCVLASLAFVVPAGAAVHPAYSAFGNIYPYNDGDCGYEAMANLELHEFPTAHITTKEVITAWHQGHDNGYNIFPFMMSTGFDGHTIDAIVNGGITTKAQIIAGVAGGGVWTTMDDGTHAAAIIGADRRFATVIDDGIVEHWTWSNFYWNQGGNVLMYAVTWAA